MHRSGLINCVYASHVGGHIRQNKVNFVGADTAQNLLQNLRLAEIALHEIDAGYGIHGQDVRRHDAARAADDARGVLAPAAGRRPEVDAADSRPEQPLALLNLRQLEYRARAPALALRAFDELIAGMFGEPTSTAF